MTTSIYKEKTDRRREVTGVSTTPLTGRPVQRRQQVPADWLEFSEYVRLRYHGELDEGLAFVERLIIL